LGGTADLIRPLHFMQGIFYYKNKEGKEDEGKVRAD
jgi:hypothetical protein